MPAPMPIAPGTQVGEYEILGAIGSGGMGEVYKARDAKLGRDVAIKVLPPGFSRDEERLRRFVQEAQAAAALNHPNILAIYQIGTHEHAPFIVSELLTGSTLRHVLAAGPMAVRKAIEYGIQIARGLAAAHDRGIVHRDLKPDNVFITEDGRVKILDFGVAKLLPAEADLADRTRTVQTGVGTVLGTVGYMAPEQLRGHDVDARADVFSLGAVLYEMLSGRRAFQKESSADTMSAVLHDDPPELTGTGRAIPPILERIIRRALEKQPQERFQSARDVAFALEDLSSASAAHAIPGDAAVRSRVWPRAVGAAAMALVIGAVVLAARRTAPQATQPIFHPVTFRRGMVLSSRFAPDGQTIVYGAAWDGRHPETFAVGTAGPESRPLGIPNSDIFGISSRGELALSVRNEFALPLTAGTLEEMPLLGGAAPRQVQDGVEYADWGPDGSMAVTLDTGLGDRLEYPIGTPLYAVEGPIHMIRISPDGARVAFMERSDRGLPTIATIDRAKHRTTLSSGWLAVGGLAWTPSGDEIWFAAKSKDEGWGLYAVARDGGAVRVVLRTPAPCYLHDLSRDGRALVSIEQPSTGIRFAAAGSTHEDDLSWLDRSQLRDLSADGKSILFTETGEGATADGAIYVRKTDGSPAVQLGSGLGYAFSPDGNWVLAATRSGTDLSLIPTGPGTAVRLKGDSRVRTGKFLHDGKSVVFIGLGTDQKLYVYVQPLDGVAHAISPGGELEGLVISPDGHTIATALDRKVCLLKLNGGAPETPPWAVSSEVPIAWSSDGKALFIVKHDPTQAIDRVEIATGVRTPWKALVPSDGAGVISVLAVRLLDDGRSYAYSYERQLSQLLVVTGLR